MPKMQPDANAKPIPALRPLEVTDVDGVMPAQSKDGILRLTSDSGGKYGVNGAAEVTLPAGVVEYIRVEEGDVLNTDSSINVTVMD